MVSKEKLRHKRQDFSDNLAEYTDRFLNMIRDQLQWDLNKSYEIRVLQLKPADFAALHPIDRLAGMTKGTEVKNGKETPAYHIDLNWENLVISEDDSLVVAQLAFCLVHEILEIYEDQTHKKIIHKPENSNKPTDEEKMIWQRCLIEILGLSEEEYSRYNWKS